MLWAQLLNKHLHWKGKQNWNRYMKVCISKMVYNKILSKRVRIFISQLSNIAINVDTMIRLVSAMWFEFCDSLS